jgi:hypothetical protein
MYVRALAHFDWQVLRALARSKEPLTGKQLRLAPTRGTKDGTFLDGLVTEGLLRVVGVDDLPADAPLGRGRAPVQFRTRYELTPEGERAAEYGEYECAAVKPAPRARAKGARTGAKVGK